MPQLVSMRRHTALQQGSHPLTLLEANRTFMQTQWEQISRFVKQSATKPLCLAHDIPHESSLCSGFVTLPGRDDNEAPWDLPCPCRAATKYATALLLRNTLIKHFPWDEEIRLLLLAKHFAWNVVPSSAEALTGACRILVKIALLTSVPKFSHTFPEKILSAMSSTQRAAVPVFEHIRLFHDILIPENSALVQWREIKNWFGTRPPGSATRNETPPYAGKKLVILVFGDGFLDTRAATWTEANADVRLFEQLINDLYMRDNSLIVFSRQHLLGEEPSELLQPDYRKPTIRTQRKQQQPLRTTPPILPILRQGARERLGEILRNGQQAIHFLNQRIAEMSRRNFS